MTIALVAEVTTEVMQMSMISEQVNRLRGYAEICRTVSDHITAKYLDGAADTIEELSAKLHKSQMERSSQYYNGGWISLDEKEPKDGQLVLVTLVNRYKQRYVKIAEFIEEDYRKHDGKIDQRYCGFHSYGGVYNVYEYADEAVAWMPLPKPYGGDADANSD